MLRFLYFWDYLIAFGCRVFLKSANVKAVITTNRLEVSKTKPPFGVASSVMDWVGCAVTVGVDVAGWAVGLGVLMVWLAIIVFVSLQSPVTPLKVCIVAVGF